MYVIQTTAISIAIEWYCKPLPINFSRIPLFKNMVLVRCFQTFRSNLTRPYLKYCKPFWQLKLTFSKVGYKSTGKLASESNRLARRKIFTVELRLMCRFKVLCLTLMWILPIFVFFNNIYIMTILQMPYRIITILQVPRCFSVYRMSVYLSIYQSIYRVFRKIQNTIIWKWNFQEFPITKRPKQVYRKFK